MAEMNKSMLHNKVRRIGILEMGDDAQGNQWIIGKDGYCRRAGPSTPAPVEDEVVHKRTPGFHQICLILQLQDEAPDHWSLYVGKGYPDSGEVIQVKGDTWPGMHRADTHRDVGIFKSNSYLKYIHLGEIAEDIWGQVAVIADEVPPPKAEKVRPDNENCQHWTLYVIRKLVVVGFVTQAKADYVAKHIGVFAKDWKEE